MSLKFKLHLNLKLDFNNLDRDPFASDNLIFEILNLMEYLRYLLNFLKLIVKRIDHSIWKNKITI